MAQNFIDNQHHHGIFNHSIGSADFSDATMNEVAQVSLQKLNNAFEAIGQRLKELEVKNGEDKKKTDMMKDVLKRFNDNCTCGTKELVIEKLRDIDV